VSILLEKTGTSTIELTYNASDVPSSRQAWTRVLPSRPSTSREWVGGRHATSSSYPGANPRRADDHNSDNVPKATLSLLHRVAELEPMSRRPGGRPSVSAVLVDLVERARKELEQEAFDGSSI
jgi:hypothetical protein